MGQSQRTAQATATRNDQAAPVRIMVKAAPAPPPLPHDSRFATHRIIT